MIYDVIYNSTKTLYPLEYKLSIILSTVWWASNYKNLTCALPCMSDANMLLISVCILKSWSWSEASRIVFYSKGFVSDYPAEYCI